LRRARRIVRLDAKAELVRGDSAGGLVKPELIVWAGGATVPGITPESQRERERERERGTLKGEWSP